MELYTTILDAILGQMLAYPDRLAACWEFSDEVEEDLGPLMGWNSGERFHEMYGSLFQGNGGTNTSERLEIVPPELEVYMSSMKRATNQVQKICSEILQERY